MILAKELGSSLHRPTCRSIGASSRGGFCPLQHDLFPLFPDRTLSDFIGHLSNQRPIDILILAMQAAREVQPRVNLRAETHLVAFKHFQVIRRATARRTIKGFMPT
jgi:hypothetical protein